MNLHFNPFPEKRIEMSLFISSNYSSFSEFSIKETSHDECEFHTEESQLVGTNTNTIGTIAQPRLKIVYGIYLPQVRTVKH